MYESTGTSLLASLAGVLTRVDYEAPRDHAPRVHRVSTHHGVCGNQDIMAAAVIRRERVLTQTQEAVARSKSISRFPWG